MVGIDLRKIVVTLFVVSMIALAGCSEAPGDPINGSESGDLRRLVLVEDNVVCYLSHQEGESDLSCLPLDEVSVSVNATEETNNDESKRSRRKEEG